MWPSRRVNGAIQGTQMLQKQSKQQPRFNYFREEKLTTHSLTDRVQSNPQGTSCLAGLPGKPYHPAGPALLAAASKVGLRQGRSWLSFGEANPQTARHDNFVPGPLEWGQRGRELTEATEQPSDLADGSITFSAIEVLGGCFTSTQIMSCFSLPTFLMPNVWGYFTPMTSSPALWTPTECPVAPLNSQSGYSQ